MQMDTRTDEVVVAIVVGIVDIASAIAVLPLPCGTVVVVVDYFECVDGALLGEVGCIRYFEDGIEIDECP